MEELAAALPPRHRERRHRRKASDAGARAAAYGDVFGGPPRFGAPFAEVPADYSEVFGGVSASCSIPYLDLPPADGGGPGAGAGGYGEIFGQFDFGGFADPYEELLEEAVAFASSSGSSRSSFRKESGQLDAEPSNLYQHYPNIGYDQHFVQEQFSPISSPPDGEQQFSMSYNKITRGRPDDIVEMTTCIVEPSISYVVDSCNPSSKSATDHVLVVESDTFANGGKGSMSPPFHASSSAKSASSDSVDDQNQHIPTCCPISKNDCEDEDYHRSSTHAASSEGAPSPDYPFLKVSNISLQTQPIKVQPPSMPPSKLLNKNDCEDEDYHRSSTHSASSEEAPSPDYPFLRVSNTSLQTQPIKVQPPSMPPSKLLNKKESKANGDSDFSTNSAATAAIKEAMEFAEARLKAAKELMERKGDSFKLRKRPGHHRGTKSTELKEGMKPEEVPVYEEKLTTRRLAKEETTYEDATLVDKNRDISAVNLAHYDDSKKGVLHLGKPHQTMQNNSKQEQIGKWTSGADFYELISHEKSKTSTATCEGDNVQTTNPSTMLGRFEKGQRDATSEDLNLCGKLWDGDDITELRMEHSNPREYAIASVEVGRKAPTAPEVSLGKEKAMYQELLYQEPADSHFKECAGAINYREGCDDETRYEISRTNGIAPKHRIPEMSSSSLESCISGGHSNESKNRVNNEETAPLGKSKEGNSNKEELKIPCADEMLCTSAQSQISQEYPEAPNDNVDKIKASQVQIPKLEEEYYETQNFQTMLGRVQGEAETFEKEKLFNFVEEACLSNESEMITNVPPEVLIHDEIKKSETEDAYIPSERDVVQKAGSLENEANIAYGSASANENEEAEVLNVSVDNCNLMESHARTCGTFGEDSDELQESQGSLGPQCFGNRLDIIEDSVCGNEKEGIEPLFENSEKIQVEAILKNDIKESQTSMKSGIDGPNDAYAEANARNDTEGNILNPGTEVTADDDSDYAMKLSTCSKDQHTSFSEPSVSMHHLSQNAESISAQTSDETMPAPENLGEDCRKAESELPTERYAAPNEVQAIGSEREGDDIDRLSNDQRPVCSDSDIIPESTDVQKSIDKNAQRIEERVNVKRTEREVEKEVFRRLDEEKERYKMEKENEQTKERLRRELEEERERERERAKDRLAVQRATREAHERAFAEARSKAERIALERITSARQRASAEAREKEEKAIAEAATEKASREARIKAERAAVERATVEARERAIGKAKAAADAKEQMDKFRSSFKDNFKATNQDNQHDKQFQRTASNIYESSTDYSNQVPEAESALRHKARSERHQRTAERAAKALSEKSMRDMLVQREQAEKHRLAEFLDPEVKRWSNGKEGNLRALLSTLQYILGSDSGWQSVPLTDLITAAAVKKAYRRATLCVHPDKLQQRGATIRQKYICEKVFDLLKEAWNKFNSVER